MFWFNLPALSVHISAVPLEGLWMWHTTWMLNHQRIHVASFFPTSSLHPILRHHRACSVPATSSSSTFTTGCPPGFFYRLMMVTHQSSSPPHSLTLSAQHPADTPWAWTCKICTSESIHACTMHTCIWSLFTSNPKSQSFQIIKAGLSRPHAGPKRAKKHNCVVSITEPIGSRKQKDEQFDDQASSKLRSARPCVLSSAHVCSVKQTAHGCSFSVFIAVSSMRR